MNTENTVVNSASKYRQSKEAIKRMAERALGRQVEELFFKELGGGMCSAVYMVEADGEKIALKMGTEPSAVLMRHEKNYIINEANMLKIFEEKIDIPAPRLIYLDASNEVCDAPYFLMSFMEGTPLLTMSERPAKEYIAAIKKQVGIITRKISSIKAETFGIPAMPETFRDNNCDFVYLLFEMLLADAGDKRIEVPGVSSGELLKMIESQRSVLNEAKQPCYIHTDTWDGNLMIKDNNLEGLIDYAAVLYGDPLMNHDFHEFGDICVDFLKGYGKTEFTHNELIRISIYKLWQRLGMIVERGFREYEDKNMYAWVLGEFTKEIDNFRVLTNSI